MLALVGEKVPEFGIDIDILRTLTKDDASRIAALEQAKQLKYIWYREVKRRTNALVTALTADVLANVPSDALERYNALVVRQNAEWEAAYPPITAPVLMPSTVSADVFAVVEAEVRGHADEGKFDG